MKVNAFIKVWGRSVDSESEVVRSTDEGFEADGEHVSEAVRVVVKDLVQLHSFLLQW